MFTPRRGNIIGSREFLPPTYQEKRMTKLAIRLLTLAAFAVASGAVPVITPAKAATDGSTTAKKKHKKMHSMSSTGGQMQAPPMSSSQAPRNMSDDPSRKVSY
jgi:hypothetical protein